MADASLDGGNFTIDGHAIKRIREALLIGLASYGEIERLDCVLKQERLIGRELSADAHAIHPTGSPDTVGEFAAALRDLEYLRPAREVAHG